MWQTVDSFFTRELEGDRLGDTDEMLIEAVKEVLRTELDPTSAIVKPKNNWLKRLQRLNKRESAYGRYAEGQLA